MWVLPSALFALLLFCKVQGDSSEGPRQVGGVALEPRSIAAPSGWMENGTEQRLGPASAFLHHARLRPLLGMHCTLALFICIYNTIPYFSVTLLIHFFFIWLACYNLQTSDIVTFFLRCLKEMAKKAHHGEWSALWLNVFLDNLPLSCAFCACIYRLQKFSFKKKKDCREGFFLFLNKREGFYKYAHVSPRGPFLWKYYIYLIHMHVLPLSLLKAHEVQTVHTLSIRYSWNFVCFRRQGGWGD